MQNSGIAFHCHHDRLYEYVWDFAERVEYIKRDKSPAEWELRLRLFQLIPNTLLPGRHTPAQADCEKARADYKKAQADYKKARVDYKKAQADCEKPWAGCEKARADCEKARADCEKARADYKKARADYVEAYGMEIIELHKQLCPACPWDGNTIFPEKEE